MAAQPANAATTEQIEQSITDGIAWLATAQDVATGSWNNHTGESCMALIKLQDRAAELGYGSPFDPAYEYSDEVLRGWQYVLSGGRTLTEPLSVQPAGNPDVNGNGYGVYFQYDNFHNVYTTSLCLMALASSESPERPNDGGLDLDGDGNVDTFAELAQDAMEWLAFAQIDDGNGRGGWYYNANYGTNTVADNSHGGYAVLGLAASENFGIAVPIWVKSELSIWIDYIQNDVSGGSGYTSPTSWVNVLKTGNLLFQMVFVGDDPTTSARFENALGYIESMWRDPSVDPGWGYDRNPADYQAMFALMKGFEFSSIELIDTDGDGVRDNDWFNQEPTASPSEDFASVLVAQQDSVSGAWPGTCNWGNQMLCTAWALLTLERVAPPPPKRLDHYQCYIVTPEDIDDGDGSERSEEPGKSGPPVQKHTVVVEDQFGEKETTVYMPQLLCNPASKDGSEILNARDHLVCYQIIRRGPGPKSEDLLVSTSDQFGDLTLEVVEPRLLCLPASKTILDGSDDD